MLTPDRLIADRYRIVRKIGQGGMGAVYEAVDERLRGTVALKQTLVTEEHLKKAFEREAQLLANLRHPNLPRVIDHFVSADGQFLVMDYITGKDLAEILSERAMPFPVEMVLRWADQLLDVLQYLHDHDPPIIHRDIKPQNAKVTTGNRLMLLDFGLAKGSALQTRSTSSGSILAYTPSYASLEQIQGSGTDVRSDLYSVGATLYNLLTGRTPLDALTRSLSRLNEEPDPLPTIEAANPQVPPAISAVVIQAMEVRAKDRPASAAAMRQRLQTATGQANGTGQAVDPSPHPPPPPPPDQAAPDVTTASLTTAPTLAVTPSSLPQAAPNVAAAPAHPMQPPQPTSLVDQPTRDWRLIFLWVAATMLGLIVGYGLVLAVIFAVGSDLVGAMVTSVGSNAGGSVVFVIVGAVIGSMVGAAQWLVLRRHIAEGAWWIVATTVGYSASFAVGGGMLFAVIDATGFVGIYVAIYVLSGAIAGVAQWMVLRQYHTRGVSWIVAPAMGATAMGLALGGMLGGAVSGPMDGTLAIDGVIGFLIGSLIGGAVGSAISAFPLESLLHSGRHPNPAAAHAGPAHRKFARLWLAMGALVVFPLLLIIGLAAIGQSPQSDSRPPTDSIPPRPASGGALAERTLMSTMADQVAEVGRLDDHTGLIYKVAFAPDGQTLATTSDDATVKLWDVADRMVLRTLEDHQYGVTSVAFSPDEQTLATGSKDNTVKLWNVADGTLLRTLEGHTDTVWSVAFAPDGQIVASGACGQHDEEWNCLGGAIIIWKMVDGSQVGLVEGHKGRVTSLAFAPDGQLIASASNDQSVLLWDTIDGALVRRLEGRHTNEVTSLAFAPDGELLATASGDSFVRLWNVADGTLLRTLEGHTSGVRSVAFAPSGRLLASGGDDGTVRLWLVADGTLLRTLEGHTDGVLSVAFAPDGRMLASGGWDGSVRLWANTQ